MNRFLFVVVLYRMSLSDAPALQSLLQLHSSLREYGMRVLVVDNTPGVTPNSFRITDEATYLSFGNNRGLASAYQFAFLEAKNEGYDYLVLLDQDSEASSEWLRVLSKISSEDRESIGIWCPYITSYGRCISPYSMGAFAWPDYRLEPGAGPLYGINSFSAVNMRFLEEAGGIEQFYWLDCLDTWLYETAHRTGWAVRQLEVRLNHDLSLVSGHISADRMKNIAFYQSCFASEHWPLHDVIGTALRLTGRGIKRIRSLGSTRRYASYLLQIIKGIKAGIERRSPDVS